MVRAFFLLLLVCFTFDADAQSPDCTQLKVESISLTDSGYLAVKISNYCTDCQSGISGCLYGEMKVISRSNPGDTLAAANCYCLMTPPNSDTQVYLLPTMISVLPALADLRVYFYCASECEDLPLSENPSGIMIPGLNGDIYYFPNPASEVIYLEYDQATDIQQIELIDNTGRVIKDFHQGFRELDLSGVPRGLYFLKVQTKQGGFMKKIILK